MRARFDNHRRISFLNASQLRARIHALSQGACVEDSVGSCSVMQKWADVRVVGEHAVKPSPDGARLRVGYHFSKFKLKSIKREWEMNMAHCSTRFEGIRTFLTPTKV